MYGFVPLCWFGYSVKSWTHPIVLGALGALACACTMEIPIGVSATSDREVVVDIPRTLDNRLDLLFVVDNSEDMDQRQRELSQAFGELYQHLSYNAQGLPDIRIGVVSTDLGAAEYAANVDSCTTNGDGGRLLAPVPSENCPELGGLFLEQFNGSDDNPIQNFDGQIEQMFQCMAMIGSRGCEYEQPLEAMRRALDDPTTGFLRPGAALGVVVLSNEDDCSMFDTALMDPSDSSFNTVSPNSRCFQKGVSCQGADDVFVPGTQQGCKPKTNSHYVRDPNEYANYLLDERPAERLVVAGLIGDSSLVEVEFAGGSDEVLLAASCDGSDGNGAAYPAVRLQSFVDGFGKGGDVAPICGKDRVSPFQSLLPSAAQLRVALGTKCLDGDIADIDDFSTGIQADCTVHLIGDGNENVAEDGVDIQIPECTDQMTPSNSYTLPCYTVREEPQSCSTFPSRLALNVYDDSGRMSGGEGRGIGIADHRVYASCLKVQTR